MKLFISRLTISLMASLVMTQAYADDAEVVLTRAKKLSEMKFLADQLSLQASMADSLKKMSDAKFLVDDDGKLVGVSDMNELGKEFRSKPNQNPNPAGPSDMPFNMPQMGMPAGAPFTLEQPTVPPGTIVQGPQSKPPVNGAPNPAAGQPPQQSEAKAEEAKPTIRLYEIRANSVLVASNDRLSEVKLGQKLNNETLKSINVDSAIFVGPEGPRILKFDWSSSNKFGSEQ